MQHQVIRYAALAAKDNTRALVIIIIIIIIIIILGPRGLRGRGSGAGPQTPRSPHASPVTNENLSL
jgi:hypothetical protein